MRRIEYLESDIKKCPFCGSPVDLMTLFTGLNMFYCRNHGGCGAIVSFDTDECNTEKGNANKIAHWNRREGEKR